MKRLKVPFMVRSTTFRYVFFTAASPLDLFHRGGVFVHHIGDGLPAFDADDAVGHGGERGVVRDDDDGAPRAAAGVLQQGQHLFAGFVVQRARGFVTQKNFWLIIRGLRSLPQFFDFF